MKRFLPIFFGLALTGSPISAQDSEQTEDLRREEMTDYYQEWLEKDVVYIISSDERDVFESLTTDEEREQFIEQFWLRRDPDMTTPTNEFKEEHYRRLAYANERFQSGVPGWKTDRGRVYIIHGPPVEIESHKMGQSYTRPSQEGGGQTITYPFEIWRYRHIEGIGSDVELEFVDPKGTGEFRLALTPWEKDALLFSVGSGRTIAEELGYATRADHPYFKPYNADRYVGMHTRRKDDPFVRYETLARVQQPLPVKYRDLKEFVDVNIQYESLSFDAKNDFFRLNDEQVLASVSFEVPNRELTFAQENGVHVARVAVYGIVTSMTNRVITEFEDDLLVSFRPADFEVGLTGRSSYQKVIPLDRKMRYRLDLIIKDLQSEKVGLQQVGLIPPRFAEDGLTSSTLVLSDFLQKIERVPDPNEMFVIGDVKVRPNLQKSFASADPFWIYLHVYNARLDQSLLEPDLTVTYRISRQGRKISEFVDQSGESIQYFSGSRVVLVNNMPISHLDSGSYLLEVEVQDRLSRESISLSESFEIQG